MSVPNSASAATSSEKPEYRITARETRLGLNLKGPGIGAEGVVKGKLETDFYGSPTGITDDTNGAMPRIRLAYIDVGFTNWGVLAGQDWDFFAPLNPSMLNLGILWRGGNLGDRHPQVTLTNRFKDIADGTVTTKVGIVDTKQIEQAWTGLPVLAGYVSYERDIMGRPFYIGAGALIGVSKSYASATTANAAQTSKTDTWGATLAAKYKILDQLTVSGEAFIGQDLDAFRGGSPLGIDNGNGLRSRGGWFQLSYAPLSNLEVNGGAGVDNVLDDPLLTNSTLWDYRTIWDYNYSYFTNFKYSILKNLIVGLEYQYFLTKYKTSGGGNANRIMTSLIYKF